MDYFNINLEPNQLSWLLFHNNLTSEKKLAYFQLSHFGTNLTFYNGTDPSTMVPSNFSEYKAGFRLSVEPLRDNYIFVGNYGNETQILKVMYSYGKVMRRVAFGVVISLFIDLV